MSLQTNMGNGQNKIFQPKFREEGVGIVDDILFETRQSQEGELQGLINDKWYEIKKLEQGKFQILINDKWYNLKLAKKFIDTIGDHSDYKIREPEIQILINDKWHTVDIYGQIVFENIEEAKGLTKSELTQILKQ